MSDAAGLTAVRWVKSTGSGPTSAPAPSAITVRPGSRSHSGCAATSLTASAHDGSMTPPSTQVCNWRARASPRNRSP